MTRYFFSLFLIILSNFAFSQQLFQDASGKTNLFFGQSPYGWITFNTSDKSSTIGYVRNRDNGYDHDKNAKYNYLYGGDIKVNMKDGQSTLFSGGAFKPGITAEGTFGGFSDNLFNKGNYVNLYLRPTLSYTQYNYVDSITGGTPVLTKVNKIEGGVFISFNFQFNQDKHTASGIDHFKHHYFFAGLQTGYNVINNYSDLDEVQMSTFITPMGNVIAEKTETGKFGKYQNYKVIPLNIDLAVTPRMFKHNYFGFNSYFRSDFLKEKNASKIGVGIYLADEKKPSNISGGFAWQFNDVFNKLKKPGTALDKSSVFFYIGYSIGK